MIRRKTHLFLILVLSAVLLFAAGCSKLTQKNFDKIEAGMTYEQVTALIGEPTSCDSVFTAKQCQWKSGDKTIDIKLLDDKVVFYSSKNL